MMIFVALYTRLYAYTHVRCSFGVMDNNIDVAGSKQKTGRQKEEKSNSAEQYESGSDYEEIEEQRPTAKAQTLPSKMQPSCMKSSKYRPIVGCLSEV